MTGRTLEPHSLDAVVAHVAARMVPGASSCEVVWATVGGQRVVVKAGAGRARGALRRESESLARIDAPRLVTPVGLHEHDSMTVLVTADAGQHTLRHPGDAAAELLLRALQHTCSVVAGLHRSGWSHGRLAPEHVIVGARGRVRLCSLGSARPTADRPDGVLEDLRRLGGLVGHVADEIEAMGGHARTVRQLRRIVEEQGDQLGHPESADGLAEHLAAVGCRRTARAGSFAVPTLAMGSRSRWLAGLGVVCGAVALGVAATSLPLADAGSVGAEPETGDGPVVPLVVDTGVTQPPPVSSPPPTIVVGSLRYRVGLPGDHAIAGDWRCEGRPTVRLLRPGTGELFEFGPGSTTGPTDGVLLDVVPEAESLSVERSGAPAECDRTVVHRADGSEQVVP